MSETEYVLVPKVPTEKMLAAARGWSSGKYGKPIGNDAAIGCFTTMIAASPAPAASRGWEPGTELWYDMAGADIRATYQGECEGWPMVTFDADLGKEAAQPVRPSRLRLRSEPKRPHPDRLVRLAALPDAPAPAKDGEGR